ncbi:BZ3500_MvSof-1268-A1-R1_Chr2-1g04091 [Microbotryum saponariae]|uniref:1-phosphatidylinositol 4-kinase n=1 Tax=Microbotryum saponariae TaxID=289078 RepID=A0A2X0KHI1_9BASI|nr:BZ3500_MvSof-1268-A1-R1_Chr2-1g04091 [Microbotryum saponariae]SCZ91078.1 BZ3501_MvSof-1269-A2-R1_Chr2-1g03747 [Microbotryum saponariae]
MARKGYAPLPSHDGQTSEQPIASTSSSSSSPAAPRTSAGDDRGAQSASHGSSPQTTSTTTTTAQHVDLMFKKWTTVVKHKMRLSRSGQRRANAKRRAQHDLDRIQRRDRKLAVPILASVFGRDGVGSEDEGKAQSEGDWETLDHEPPLSDEAFNELVDQVREAISLNVQPRLNSKGSSGSYFAKDKHSHTLAIFKPKDEEPYGNLNPKLTKWLHRNFFSRIIPFGRACLIPQLSYLSESAASLMDRRLETHIVPPTQVVPLSSPAFFYDWIDRERAQRQRQPVPLPDKPGSFQVFLKGFKDASDFLREFPLPGRPESQTMDRRSYRKGRGNLLGPLRCLCGRVGADVDDDDEEDEDGEGEPHRLLDSEAPSRRGTFGFLSGGASTTPDDETGFKWTEEMLESFREELEKLVILDFIIRNTDRGLDNFMIKPCLCAEEGREERSWGKKQEGMLGVHGSRTKAMAPTTEPPSAQPPMTEINARNRRKSHVANQGGTASLSESETEAAATVTRPHLHIAAIDNSLAFPHMHPLGFRTYTYGWLYLPLTLIGQPFTTKTRRHFLPLLTDPEWWAETTLALRNEFAKDGEFREDMFRKQMAVMKGQAYNVVLSLRSEEDGESLPRDGDCLSRSSGLTLNFVFTGPIELCRRPKKLVWDDLIEVADHVITDQLLAFTAAGASANTAARAAGIGNASHASGQEEDDRAPTPPLQQASPPPMESITTPPRPLSPLLDASSAPTFAFEPNVTRNAIAEQSEGSVLRPVPLQRVSTGAASNKTVPLSAEPVTTPIAMPSPALSTTHSMSNSITRGKGHKASSSISSVLGSFPEEIKGIMRGVDAVEQLDRREGNARGQRGGGLREVLDEHEEEDDQVDEEDDVDAEGPTWGVQSENDIRRPASRPQLGGKKGSWKGVWTSTHRKSGSYSDARSLGVGGGRMRSGSLDMGRGGGGRGSSEWGGRRSGEAGRLSGSDGRRGASEALLEEGDEEGAEEEEGLKTRVVVVERLEVLRERPRTFIWC